MQGLITVISETPQQGALSMHLNISAHHLNITPGIESHLRNKLRPIKRHFDHPIKVGIILSVSKNEHKAEAKLHLFGRDLFCESTGLNLYNAIDDLAIKTDRQVLKLKARATRYSTDSIRKLQMAVGPV